MQGQVRLGNTVGENPDIEANLDALIFFSQNLQIWHCLPFETILKMKNVKIRIRRPPPPLQNQKNVQNWLFSLNSYKNDQISCFGHFFWAYFKIFDHFLMGLLKKFKVRLG